MSAHMPGLRPLLAATPAASPARSAASPTTSASFAARLEAKAAAQTAPTPEASADAPASGPPPSLLVEAERFVAAITRDQTSIDQRLSAASSGRTLTARELLALQMDVYGVSQKVELAAKVVEKGVGTVRRVVDLQV